MEGAHEGAVSDGSVDFDGLQLIALLLKSPWRPRRSALERVQRRTLHEAFPQYSRYRGVSVFISLHRPAVDSSEPTGSAPPSPLRSSPPSSFPVSPRPASLPFSFPSLSSRTSPPPPSAPSLPPSPTRTPLRSSRSSPKFTSASLKSGKPRPSPARPRRTRRTFLFCGAS